MIPGRMGPHFLREYVRDSYYIYFTVSYKKQFVWKLKEDSYCKTYTMKKAHCYAIYMIVDLEIQKSSFVRQHSYC